MNPYLILRVPASAGDAEIRRAYLEGIREFPPESSPDRFQALAHAYEQLRDEAARLNYRIFDREPGGASPGEVFSAFCSAAPPPKPLDFTAMKAFLRSCTKT
jgi:curved DNA-binding protein CbpA